MYKGSYLCSRFSTFLWSSGGFELFLDLKGSDNDSFSLVNSISSVDNTKAYGLGAGSRSKLMLPTYESTFIITK